MKFLEPTPEEVRRRRLRMGYFVVAYGVLFVVVSVWFILESWSWVLFAILVVGVLLIFWGIRRVRNLRSGMPSMPQG